MKKSFILVSMAIAALCPAVANADSIKEDFESNSLEWTECSFKDAAGTAIIDKGVMTVTSKGENKLAGALLSGLSGIATKVGEDTFFETHCYAPIDPLKPFKIIANVTIDKLGYDKLAGLVFNYRDGGNFYCFSFNDGLVNFKRHIDGKIVGAISQSVKWENNKKLNQTWELESDGQQLTFFVDGMQIMKVRYMPIDYAGVGFYTFGKQKLVIDDIEFIQ